MRKIVSSFTLELSRRICAAAANWLTFKRVKTYGISLPLVGAAVLAADTLAKQSLLLFYKGDFILFYTGGKYLLTGRLAQLYDFAAQDRFQAAVLKLPSPQFTPFNHPPFTVIFYAPFALGSYELGLFFWTAAGTLALALAWGLLRREIFSSSVYSTAMLTLSSFCFYPTIAWLLANQNSAFTFLLYVLFFVELRRRRDFAAGAALGLLLYKPQLALIPAFILLLKGRGRALGGFLLTSSLLLGLGFLMSPQSMMDYLRLLPRIAELPFLPGYPVEKMHNFYGFSLLLIGNWATRRTVEMVAISLAAVGFIIVARWWHGVAWQPGTRQWDLTFACTLALGLLVSPHLMLYDLMLLLLPIAIVCAAYSESCQRLLDGGPLLVATVLLFVAVFVSTYATMGMLQLSAALALPKSAVQLSVPVILLWCVAVRSAARAAPERNCP